MLRTAVYIDGFNLYFGCLKDTPHRWLDLKKLCENMLQPHNEIITIKYFTAHVSARASNQDKPIRQQIYLRALKHSIPELEVILGQFTTHTVNRKLDPPIGLQKYAGVIETREKGSDVNLAVHLVNDAWRDQYDCALVVSSDSDLVEAIKLVRGSHPEKKVGVLVTGKQNSTKEMIRCASFVKKVRTSALMASQLPPTIEGTSITKPIGW
ncbi:NYN domain-containing protein [Pseudomonas juntendi]|uniref:NYN domain-containing protein n=1 Tax=Pseudomonas juntendi TaxID=2666183 RepID=A0AAJ5RTU7_9PSED|nr:NYN domain-containing protein [Pseudomonas juntendi]WEA18653.1 NYN domain-containing protein [Pseudomonas juntendi]